MKEVNLSHNPMFSRSWLSFSMLTRFLKIINNIESINLSYCDLTGEAEVSRIMKILNNLYSIKYIKFLQYTNDAYLKDETQTYLKVVSEAMK